MTLDEAIELVKYGNYAKGQKGQHPTNAKREEALRMVLNNPDVWDQIMWGDKQ